MSFNHQEIERKWQKKWEKKKHLKQVRNKENENFMP